MAPPATITVFDNLYDFAGNGINGATVNCILNGSQETTSGGLINPKQQSTTTDGNGRFTFTVVANDLLSPANSTYTVITPFRTYDIAPQSANGNSQQTTAANVIVNTPSPLAPSTSNITGNLTIAGTLTVSGLVTAQAGLTVSGGTFSIPAGGFTMAGPLTLTAAASQIIPGATSFSIRDTGNANDNLLVSNAGAVTARTGLTVTAGGLTVSAGGATVTGNSTVTGTLTVTSTINSQTISSAANLTGSLTVATGVTVTAGGVTITAGNLTVTAGQVTFAAAASKITPGATSLALTNNANNASNLLLTDAGLATLRNGILIPAAAAGALAPNSAYTTVPIKIDDQLLAATATTITFANPLPTAFRHLWIDWTARGDTAANFMTLQMRFNNDSGAHYNYERSAITDANATSNSEGLIQTSFTMADVVAANGTAGYFSSGRIVIWHYNGTVANKAMRSDSQYSFSNATGQQATEIITGQWTTTATAITRIDLLASAGNFIIGSLFTLYGIP